MQRQSLMTMRNSFFIAALLLAAGCASMPERIEESLSPFDGASEISLEPSIVCLIKGPDPCFIRLGLFKRSTMRPDSVILVVVVNGTNAIAEGESLHFNMDGEVADFDSIDNRTQYSIGRGPHTAGTALCGPSASCSVKRYLVTKDFLKKLLQADKRAVRVDLGKGYLGGFLLKDNPTFALPAFIEFYERVFGPVDDRK